MTQLPRISGRQAVNAFENAGWRVERRSKKNHFILGKPNVWFKLSIPDHMRILAVRLKRQTKKAVVERSLLPEEADHEDSRASTS